MKPISLRFTEILSKEQPNFWLWVPILFGFGSAFYIIFEVGFLANFLLLLFLFFAAVFLAYLNKDSYRSLIYIAFAIFLAGSFYVNFYQKIILNQTPINGKFYVDGIGKVESINKFYNPINHQEGASLVLSNPILYKAEFIAKKAEIKKIKIKKKKKIKKEQQRVKKRKSQKQKAEELGLTVVEYKEKIALEKVKKAEEKLRGKQRKLQEKIQKTFINIDDYQDIDRKFLDISKNYQEVKWQEVDKKMRFVKPPKKILINLVKYQNNISINDVIALKMMLQPPDNKELPDDFDLKINAAASKITAYGFGFGQVKILKKAEISGIDEYFINLRQEIRSKILAVVSGDCGEIILALLIGEQKGISEKSMKEIRSSGLAHLLSISGFHLSLMATIFLVTIRFLLSRSEYLALNFDLKKIAAFFSIIATYFYLKISGAPLPAQRSFLMVLFVLVAIFLSEKINAKRVVMAAALLMTLFNPYNIFNIGFQLSFLAIIVLSAFYDRFSKWLENKEGQGYLGKVFWYFVIIILTSIAIQIATIPLLMRSFQNISLLGFVANILAIPLASFFVMPLGFLSLFLMPFNLEKYSLLLMKHGVILIEKIAHFVTNLEYSYFISPQLSSLGVVLAIIGILLICLSRTKIWIFGALLFLLSFSTIYFNKKPIISFNKDQKFFAIYDKKNGLIFSKNLHPSKTRKLWLKRFEENDFKYLGGFSKEWQSKKNIFCDEKKCLVMVENKKFLILLKRQKVKEICNSDFDVIVNLTRKYQLPDCIKKNKMKVDNLDFFQKGGWFFYSNNHLSDNNLIIRNSI